MKRERQRQRERGCCALVKQLIICTNESERNRDIKKERKNKIQNDGK